MNQHQQPYPGPQFPQPPKPGMSDGKKIGIILGAVFGIPILFFMLIALGSSGTDTSGPTPATVAAAPETSSAAPATTKPPAAPKPKPKPPVQLTAKNTKFAPSFIHDGGEFTSVKVTITNNSHEKITVNIWDFTITDTKGTKHDTEFGMDENELDSLDLAPGENTTGVITGKGKFTPKYVTYDEGWLEDPVRATVS